MESEKTRTVWIDLARVLAISLVSLNHAVNRTYAIYSAQSKEYYAISFASTVFKTAASVLSHVGVPLFLMISGALIMKKSFRNESDIRNFYKKNLLGIFLTTEIWYLIIYWGLVLYSDYNNIAGAVKGCIETLLFINQKTFGSMWYMPMILCSYLVLPFFAIIAQKYSPRVFLLSGIVVYLSGMLVPFINRMLFLSEREKISFALKNANVFSIYLLYIIVGFWIGQGGLDRLKTGYLLAALFLLIISICIIQLLAFRSVQNYVATYDCPFFLPIAACVFALIKRHAGYICRGKQIERCVEYLAQISFGIYFVHICIMTLMVKCLSLDGWYRPVKCIFYQVTSIIGSIVIIWILSHIEFCKKYLFLIKDSTSGRNRASV